MARKESFKSKLDGLRSMAEQYGMQDNPLFLNMIEQYAVQIRVIDVIKSELDASDPAVSKEYVKGRENLYAHPLIKELPKHADSATRTAGMIVNIIKELGAKKGKEDDGFEAFINERK